MSIANKALRLAIGPLLKERYQTGSAEGRVEANTNWDEWLKRQEGKGFTFDPGDPPPSSEPA